MPRVQVARDSCFSAEQIESQHRSSNVPVIGTYFGDEKTPDRFAVHSLPKELVEKNKCAESGNVPFRILPSTFLAGRANSQYPRSSCMDVGAGGKDRFALHSLPKESVKKMFGGETLNVPFRENESTFHPNPADSKRRRALPADVGGGAKNRFAVHSLPKELVEKNKCAESGNVPFRILPSTFLAGRANSQYKRSTCMDVGAGGKDRFALHSLPKETLAKMTCTETTAVPFRHAPQDQAVRTNIGVAFGNPDPKGQSRRARPKTPNESIDDIHWRARCAAEVRNDVSAERRPEGRMRAAQDRQRALVRQRQRENAERFTGGLGPARWNWRQFEDVFRQKIISHIAPNEAQAEGAYKIFGRPRAGITKENFGAVLARLGIELSDADIGRVLDVYDADGNGNIDFEEMMTALMPPEFGEGNNRPFWVGQYERTNAALIKDQHDYIDRVERKKGELWEPHTPGRAPAHARAKPDEAAARAPVSAAAREAARVRERAQGRAKLLQRARQHLRQQEQQGPATAGTGMGGAGAGAGAGGVDDNASGVFKEQRATKFDGAQVGGARWSVRILFNGRMRHVGSFSSEKEARRAFDTATAKLYAKAPTPGSAGEASAKRLPFGFGTQHRRA